MKCERIRLLAFGFLPGLIIRRPLSQLSNAQRPIRQLRSCAHQTRNYSEKDEQSLMA